MNIALPLACLGIATISILIRHEKPTERPPGWTLLALFAVALGTLALAAWRFSPAAQFEATATGLLVGGMAVLLGALIDRWRPEPSALLSLGAAGPAILLMVPSGSESAELACAASAGIAALVFRSRSASLVALVLSTVCLAAIIASHSDSSFVHPAGGVALIAGIALVGMAGSLLSRVFKGWDRISGPIVAGAIVILAYAASIRYLSLGPGWIGLCLAPVAALIATWLLASDEARPDAFGSLVSAAIWLGLATASFGLTKSFGVSLALVVAAGTLLALNAERAVVSLGPLLAVVLTQTFRVIHPDALRSVDVGQHYVLIGLVLGALVPLLPEEWLERVKPQGSFPEVSALAVWVAILCASPLMIGVYLAPKGLLGFIAGLGFSGFFGGIRSKVALTVPAVSVGLGCLTMKTYEWMGDLTNLPRGDKVHWMEVFGLSLTFLAIVLGGVGTLSRIRPQGPAQPTEAQ